MNLQAEECLACNTDPCRCDDPDYLFDVEVGEYLDRLRPLQSRAERDDRYADLAGQPAVSMKALAAACRQIASNIESNIRVGHGHEWGDDDRCVFCNADGRA